MSWLGPLFSTAGVALACTLLAYFYVRRRRDEHQLLQEISHDLQVMSEDTRELVRKKMEQAGFYRERLKAERSKRRLIARARRSVRAPSFSQWMVRGAIRRLPIEMNEAEKTRWGDEMAADVASVPGRLRRLRYAFGVWRKGAPKMPVAGAGAPRSAD